MRRAVLNPGWMLRGWTDIPYALTRWGYGDCRPLSLDGFYVLSSCDGKTNFDSFAFLPKHRQLLDDLITDGIAREVTEQTGISPIQAFRKADNPFIRGIEWNITGRCNLKCRHCYMESPDIKYGHVSTKDIERLVDQFAAANVMEVSLTGGEPFMRKDLMQILEMVAARGIWLGQIYSNGLLIKQKHLDRIKELGFLPAFQISFDTVNGHDDMRGVKGVVKPTVKAIRFLVEAGFPVVVATSIDRRNVGGLEVTYELLKGLGVVSWRVSTPEKSGNWRNQETDLDLDSAYAACEPVAKRWVKDGKPFHIQLCGFFKAGQTTELSEIDKIFNFTPESLDCQTCREQANVLPDGTLVPCPGYVDGPVEKTMPNLLTGPDFSTAWSGNGLRYFADLKLKDVLAENPGCAKCPHFSECGLGCRAAALEKTGQLLSKDPVSCQIFHSGYRSRMRNAVLESQG